MELERPALLHDPGDGHRQADPGLRPGDDLPGGGVHQLGLHDGRQHRGRDPCDRHLYIPAALFYPGADLRGGEGVARISLQIC